jgi:predicted kinase
MVWECIDMRYVEILKGLPASGKSTYAKEKVEKSNCGVKRVNKDDLRAMLDNGKHSKGNESYVLQLRDNIILTALDLGKSVIVDDTNLHPKHEATIRQLVKDFNAGMYGDNTSLKNPVVVKVKEFNAKPEDCIKFDLKRPNSVGAKVIWDMYNRYIKEEKDPKNPKVLKQDDKLPHAIICDLDGTLCIHQNRSPFDYDKCDTDKLNKIVDGILFGYNEQHFNTIGKEPTIIFLSGREDSCIEKTKKWLEKHNWGVNNDNCLLMMRKTGDTRKDSIIKREIFDNEIFNKYHIDFVLDDRNQVVEMWRELGLTCLQVADGNF